MRARATGALFLCLLLLLSFAVGVGCSSCGGESNDGTKPVSQDLPDLDLRDDTADLLITWIDDEGDHHVVQHPQDVPEGAREAVRVVTLNHGHGDTIYVADLRKKNADGTYPVHTMARSSWDLIAEKRRAKTMADLAPTASASATAGDREPPLAPPSSKLTAIVYAASWCSACRSAEAYLRSQGVKVVVRDIEKDPGVQAEMDRKLHRAGLPKRGTIPVIDIRGRILVGLDKREIRRAIREATRGDML